MIDLVKKLKSQIGDDVCEIYSHEALFSEAAAEITRLRAALTARDERMKAEGAREAQAKIARLTMIANELSWSKKTRDISNRLSAALQENANE